MDHRARQLERAAALGLVDTSMAAATRARAGLCCNWTGWSAPWTRCTCGLPPSLAEAESWVPSAVSDPTEDYLTAVRERWLGIGLATGATDVLLAEAGIRLVYEAAELEPPSEIIHVGSPGAAIDQVSNQVSNQVYNQVYNQVRNQVRNQVYNQVWNQVWNQVYNQVWDQVCNQVYNQVRNQVRNQVWDQVKKQVYNQICFGQHDAHWLGFFEALLGLGHRPAAMLRGHQWIARAAGWWWPFEKSVIVSARPTEIVRVGGRVSRIIYQDGWAVEAE